MDEPPVNANEPGGLFVAPKLVPLLWMEVGGLDAKVDIPAVSATNDGCEQDLRPGRDSLLSCVVNDVRDGTKEPTEPTSVVMHSYIADEGERH
jgi:hypothetical protein